VASGFLGFARPARCIHPGLVFRHFGGGQITTYGSSPGTGQGTPPIAELPGGDAVAIQDIPAGVVIPLSIGRETVNPAIWHELLQWSQTSALDGLEELVGGIWLKTTRFSDIMTGH
jgi:hypothetical protein